MARELEYVLGATGDQLRAWMACRSLVSLIMGPRGSGKTVGAGQRCIAQMAEQAPNAQGVRPTRGLVTRASYAELESATLPDFRAWCGEFMSITKTQGGDFIARSKPGYRLEDGSRIDAEVIFRTTGAHDAAERGKGLQLSWWWANEASGLPQEFFTNVMPNLGRYPSGVDGGVACTQRNFFGDMNAIDDTHWLFPLVTNPPPGWKFFRQPGGLIDTGQTDSNGRKIWRQNPDAENLEHLSKFAPNYYLDLAAGMGDDAINVLLANEFGFFVDGMPVHPWYVDSIHCAPDEFEPMKGVPTYIGMDFGRTPAATLWQRNPSNGRWSCYDELTSQNMSAELFAPELKRMLDHKYPDQEYQGYGDPAGDGGGQNIETSPIEIVRAKGIPMQPAPSNVASMRRAALTHPALRTCMDGRPALVISPRCKMLRKGMMGGFCYKRLRISGTEQYAQEPDKASLYSHVVESAEYALLGAGEGRAAVRRPQHMRQAQAPAVAEGGWWG